MSVVFGMSILEEYLFFSYGKKFVPVVFISKNGEKKKGLYYDKMYNTVVDNKPIGNRSAMYNNEIP